MSDMNFFKRSDGIPFVKICGLTDPLEAIECVKSGADAIGLVFYDKSPRSVSIDKAVEICQCLSQDVVLTGVFVNEDYNFIMERVDACSLKAVQLHGSESPELVRELSSSGVMVIKALFAEKKPYLKDAALFTDASAFLVECGMGNLPGGNAERWDWQMAKQVEADCALVLAGGLTPDNVVKAIKLASPDGVDVSSGVEISYGRKDLKKVKQFIKNVKSAAVNNIG